MAGRKPLGPALVKHLAGSPSAKERLELILATIAGQVTVVAAAQRLGISEAMFYKLRNRVLQASLEDLEPKLLGRPAQVPSAEEVRSVKLAAQVAELDRELSLQTIRLELAHALPHVVRPAQSSSLKKTTGKKRSRRKLRRRPKP
jgi:transposase-like protein